ncbi:hypothetical protein CEXT_296421 [Caerostris extrusa]|uniref:Uncharacterized protein n=1 Tax=Caerostris extrusa TaxID=172846 RepID=A0AAV4Y8X8_CAEEX|nr:hypothetical protein CEXT_296421 [Caerostris extrusa]
MCNSGFYGTKPAPFLTKEDSPSTPSGTGQKEQDVESSSPANCSSIKAFPNKSLPICKCIIGLSIYHPIPHTARSGYLSGKKLGLKLHQDLQEESSNKNKEKLLSFLWDFFKGVALHQEATHHPDKLRLEHQEATHHPDKLRLEVSKQPKTLGDDTGFIFSFLPKIWVTRGLAPLFLLIEFAVGVAV